MTLLNVQQREENKDKDRALLRPLTLKGLEGKEDLGSETESSLGGGGGPKEREVPKEERIPQREKNQLSLMAK